MTSQNEAIKFVVTSIRKGWSKDKTAGVVEFFADTFDAEFVESAKAILGHFTVKQIKSMNVELLA